MKRDRLLWQADGWDVNPSHLWAEDKYSLLFNYIDMFSTAMAGRWDKRVYIDLYSGPGCTLVSETGKWLKGSPLLALSVKKPFDKYIFCEKDAKMMKALRERVTNHFSHLNVDLIEGDCSQKVPEILNAIPKPSSKQKVLSFCFVDPFSLDLKFQTIQRLASVFVDFLVLLALDMDGRRNLRNYVKPNSNKIDEFLGISGWRERWKTFSMTDDSFQRFLASEFEKQMISLGYLKYSKGNTKRISTPDHNLPLYHLAFFSRNKLGYAFWDQCLRYSSDQQVFDF
jgi:three-Cys-motif partner protein